MIPFTKVSSLVSIPNICPTDKQQNPNRCEARQEDFKFKANLGHMKEGKEGRECERFKSI